MINHRMSMTSFGVLENKDLKKMISRKNGNKFFHSIRELTEGDLKKLV